MEYNKIDIQHICSNICSGGTPKSTITEYYGGNIPWLNTKEINFNRISETEKTITDEGLNNSSAKWIPAKSVIVAMYGATAGKTAITQIPLTTNQACCNLTIDSAKADYRFVYYALYNDYTYLASLANGGAQQNLNAQQIKDFEIPFPSLKEQKYIANILSSLDDKIELNRRINDNLEQQAQALFKSWFVDFEPFLREEFFKSDSLFGDIPVGWHIVAIKDLSVYITDYVANGSFASLRENVRLYDKPNYAHFIRNTDLKAESYKMYVDKHSYEFLSKSVLEGGEIIISNVGDVGSVFLCPKLEKPMTLGNNIILLRPKKDYLTFYLYMLFKGGIGQHLIDGVTGGSAQRKFNKTDFKSIKLMMPSVNILIKFDRIVKPIFSKIEENRDEISRLTSLRDTLLPKLMSGELKINDINN